VTVARQTRIRVLVSSSRVGFIKVLVHAAGFRVRLLNGFELSAQGRVVALKAGPQRLVTFLALYGRQLPRTYVAGALWPDFPSDRASANLRASIWRVPEPCRPLIELTARDLSLAAEATVDYRDATALAHRLIDASACGIEDLGRQARDELSSELLPACYDEWVLIERERFRQLRVHALEAQCQRLTAGRRYGEAIDAGLAAVRAEPLRESAHRVLIRAHLAEGNAAEARRQYELYRKILRDELGVEPSIRLLDLTARTSETIRRLVGPKVAGSRSV
jgi:DNA-binding SARP family transcriptional activator